MLNKLPLIVRLFIISLLTIGAFLFVKPSFAQTPTPDITTGWVRDQEVTFVGKTATRANGFLEWTLSVENYRWITLPEGANNNPIQSFWAIVRNIVFVMLSLFVLGAAFVMIITRGQNLTVMKFIPRFIMIVILVVLSFAIIRFLYQATDVIQGFFLNVKDPVTGQNRNIGPQDLLFIAFDYESFRGYRKLGIDFDESAFISLLLVKLTAITYYVMTGLLLIRKIILWFFIIVSPIFPLLFFFRPVRNTAKIWIGEFFRWLLYAPLFALFLHGLVNVWRSGIPMSFDFSKVGSAVYPTAINILLGGPGQQIGLNNSVNLKDTFALYVVALLMLWVVILLPFLLLQIFLDYLSNVSIAESPVIKKITSNSWFNKAYGGQQPPPGSPPQQPSPFGLAKSIPFFNKRAMEIPTSRTTSTLERASLTNLQTVRETKDVLRLANLSIPKMKDIARYETSLMKHDTVSRSEISRFHDTLEKISKPTTVATPVDRQKFTTIKEKLVTQQKKGDKLAENVLSATKVSEEMGNKTKAVTPGQKQASLTSIKEVKLPHVNQVQQVSIEEYEDVRKMWLENYQNMETPIGPNGIPTDKHSFIQSDIANITETINLLSSDNQENVDKGMERVANILPFLLLGGFSKTEVISYLKAKMEAAKTVIASVDAKTEDEDTMVERRDETKSGQAEMVMHQELPTDEPSVESQNPDEKKDDDGQNPPGSPPSAAN
ncbi:MAG: hypothetical protein Q7T54_05610 [Candidatus Levybacteria bacterium]|nr:hypothetical protein [Candidatus Levybacteria bacterium]